MNRTMFETITELLTLFPAIAILGPRQCGKTTLARQFSENERRFLDMERAADRQQISDDPDLFLNLQKNPLAIDEAQLVPHLFPALRVAIDSNKRPGQYIITGSSSPDLLKQISESLAGRIATLHLSPFTFAESCNSVLPTMANLIRNRQPLHTWPLHLSNRGSKEELFTYWHSGGYPEPTLKKNTRFRQIWFENYISTYLERDIGKLFPGLNRERFRLFLRLLAQQSGQIINMSQTAKLLDISVPTAKDYYRIAEGTFIWRQLPAWSPQTIKRLVKHPKGYLRDSGLLHHQLHLADQEAVMTHPSSGHSFECMVIEQILRQLEFAAIGFEASHFRSANGMEIDLILEGDFGRVAVEIKRGTVVKQQSITQLSSFITEFKADYGIIIHNNDECGLFTKKILGIPACMI